MNAIFGESIQYFWASGLEPLLQEAPDTDESDTRDHYGRHRKRPVRSRSTWRVTV